MSTTGSNPAYLRMLGVIHLVSIAVYESLGTFFRAINPLVFSATEGVLRGEWNRSRPLRLEPDHSRDPP
jgi:hypothetical protein